MNAKRKLHLIEKLLKVNDDAILSEVEIVLNRALPQGKPFKRFKVSLTPEEVDEFERIIEEGCGMASLHLNHGNH